MSETSQPNQEQDIIKAEAIAYAVKNPTEHFTDAYSKQEGELRSAVEKNDPLEYDLLGYPKTYSSEQERKNALAEVEARNESISARQIAKAEEVFNLNPNKFSDADSETFRNAYQKYNRLVTAYHQSSELVENATSFSHYVKDEIGGHGADLSFAQEAQNILVNLNYGDIKGLNSELNRVRTGEASLYDRDVIAINLEKGARLDYKAAVIKYNEFIVDNADPESDAWVQSSAYLADPGVERTRNDIARIEEARNNSQPKVA